MTSVLVQSGVLSDRSKVIRFETETIVKEFNLNKKKVEIITSGLENELSTKKIIKISLFMPKLGNGLKTIDELSPNQYAWASLPHKPTKQDKGYDILYESEKLKPWKLIKKR